MTFCLKTKQQKQNNEKEEIGGKRGMNVWVWKIMHEQKKFVRDIEMITVKTNRNPRDEIESLNLSV